MGDLSRSGDARVKYRRVARMFDQMKELTRDVTCFTEMKDKYGCQWKCLREWRGFIKVSVGNGSPVTLGRG